MVATARGEMLLHASDGGGETSGKHSELLHGSYVTDGDGMVVYG